MAHAKELVPIVNLDKELIDLEKRLDSNKNYIPTKRDMMILNIRKKLSSTEALESGESPLTTAEFAFYYGLSRPRVDQLGRDVVHHLRKDVITKARDPKYRESLPQAVVDKIKGDKLMNAPVELPKEMEEDFNKLSGINEQSDEDYAKAGKLADYYNEVKEVGPITDEFVIQWAERFEIDLGEKLEKIKQFANEIVGFKHEMNEGLGEIGEIETESETNVCTKCGKGTDQETCPRCGAPASKAGDQIDAAEYQFGDREEQLLMDFKKLSGFKEEDQDEGAMKSLYTKRAYQGVEKDRGPQEQPWFKKSMKAKVKHPEDKVEVVDEEEKVVEDYAKDISKNIDKVLKKVNSIRGKKIEAAAEDLFETYQDEIYEAMREYGSEAAWNIDKFMPDAFEVEEDLKAEGFDKEEVVDIMTRVSALITKHVKNNWKKYESGKDTDNIEEGDINDTGYIQKEPVPPGPKSPKPGDSLIDEQTPTLPQQPGTATAQPTAEPMLGLKPNDKVSVAGIPSTDPVNKYNNRAGIVISSGPEGTTLRLDGGAGDVKFNSTQYLKKV